MLRYLYKMAQQRYKLNPKEEHLNEIYADTLLLFLFIFVTSIILISQLWE